jgi:glycosyltransferase involved in cell wall biosynthesis
MFLDPLRRAPDTLLDGVWRDFGRAAAAARRAGARVSIVQAAWDDAEREIAGVPSAFVRGHRRLLDRVVALAPDVLHYEGLILPRGVRALAAALPDIPILAQDHATRCPRGWRRWWYRWGFAPLAGVAFTARAQAERFVAAGVLRRDLPIYEVIEVSTSFTPGDQRAARATTGLEGDPCLLWVGHLDANKDPLTVLGGVTRVLATLPDLRLYMCFQNDALLPVVRGRLAADPALARRVRLLGRVPHQAMEAHYRAADFLVQASHVEGSGYAVIEALACGTTPLVTDIPSFRRITGGGAVGALLPVGNAARFGDAIRAWSARDRAESRAAARRHFERELSFDAIGRQLRLAYDQVVVRAKRGKPA